MKKKLIKVISFVLIICMVAGFIPDTSTVRAQEQPETYSLSNDNIEVIVSTENGGFLVRTKDGDVFNKDDKNKNLLFHSGEYDTSFTSFEVTKGGEVKEYIFGGNYSFLGLGNNNLEVRKIDNQIVSTWSVDDLNFTQVMHPIWEEGADEHGTVAIYYEVTNDKEEPVDVRARILLDTALGDQNYGYYELARDIGGYERIENERIVDEEKIPANFFAYDDYNNPSITAYTVNDISAGGTTPYQVAFGHWNNLASTVFDFEPDPDLTFTNRYNKTYRTADSAYALYYDLGTVPANSTEEQSLLTYYGIYSNVGVSPGEKFSVNITSPSNLDLSDDKTMYMGSGGEADGIFEVTTNIGNIIQDGATDYDEVAVAVFVDAGLDPLTDAGVSAGADYDNPYRVRIDNFRVGESRQLTWDFAAEVFSAPGFRKINFRVYNMPESANNMLLLENLMGSASTYVLCPGGDGDLPEILFTGSSPDILYYQGTRHYYLAGSGFDMLRDRSRYSLRAYPKMDEAAAGYTISSNNIIFTEDDDGNTIIHVVMTEEMELGEYELVFEWASGQAPAGIEEKLTAPALSFVVTDDSSYRNDYYGIIAAVKPEAEAGQWEYYLEAFPGEVQFAEFKENYDGEILVELRGEFDLERGPDENVISATAVTVNENDTININGVIDVINGDVKAVLSETDGKKFVYIDMEGEILTSYSRTPVWDGVANLTPLVYGNNYGLITYNERGERQRKQFDTEICIEWSSDYKILQTIGGIVADLRYGEFGRMMDTTADPSEKMGYVLSFGASVDLSNLMPGGKAPDDSEPLPLEVRYAQKYSGERTAQNVLAKHNTAKKNAEKENKSNKTKPVGKVNVEDILFGLNEGYIGFNAEAELTLPKYVDALPELGGKLGINTINDYSFFVQGKTKTAVFEMEFELRVQSAPDSGAPVPDKIFFRIGGFKPGFNVDGAGVVWLTGGGGGIDKLYDTIFASGVPPLTLMLSADFNILQVMSSRAELSLSLRGFRFTVSQVKIKGANIVVLKSGRLALEWYPDFYLMVSASMSLLKIIEGSAYLVVDKDFFEFFMRVGIQIPKDVPIAGGITLGEADLGANNDRIWGAVSLLKIRLGICYYWGGDFSFGTGGETIQPTYPQLLGFEDIPVDYDEETGKTLYMRVGTNLSLAGQAEVVEDLDSTGLVLLGDAPSIRSDAAKTEHRLNLGLTDNGDDFAFAVDFPENGPETIAEAQEAVTVEKPDNSKYELTFYDPETNNGAGNAEDANANLIYDEETGASSVSVTITEFISGDWDITTTSAADIILYNVASLPQVNSLTADEVGGNLELTWEGSRLDETTINFYATEDIGNNDENGIGDIGTYLGSVEGTPAAEGQTIELAIPQDLPTGDYYVRMTVSKEEEANDLHLAKDSSGDAFMFEHENKNQPAGPDAVTIENSGNLMFEVNTSYHQDPGPDAYDGYIINVYEQGENESELFLTDLAGLDFEKDAKIAVGGSYTGIEGDEFGLAPEKSYVVGVSAYKTVNNGTEKYMIASPEKLSLPMELRRPDPPEITFRADAGHQVLERSMAISENESNTFEMETFTTNDVEFTLLPSDNVVSGEWYIDTMSPVEVSNVTPDTGLAIKQYLPDGDHTVTFTGENAQGDRFLYSKVFSVNTTPPRLMLTSPTNGTFFSEDGSLTVSGVTDTKAIFTIKVNGDTVVDKKTLAEMGHSIAMDGTFNFDLVLDPGFSSHEVEIAVEDQVGNSADTAATVKNSGLSGIERLDILKDDIIYSNNNLALDENSTTTAELSLLATTASGNQFVIEESDMVIWQAEAKEGNASIDEDGLLAVSPDSVGFVTASFRVAESASMTAAITFGAEIYGDPGEDLFRLDLASTVGGTVSGKGNYAAATPVALTAEPHAGYRFVGWSSSDGGNFEDENSPGTTFIMPANDTVVTGRFEHVSRPPSGRITFRERDAEIDEGVIEKGTRVSVTLPPELLEDGSAVVPYYILDGEKYIVQRSTVIDGELVFVAPLTGEFGYAMNKKDFLDVSGHWAEEHIQFAAARELFIGVGDDNFAPDGRITRAMFVTVISRLEGVDLSINRSSPFTDVEEGSWYEAAAAWARETGIVTGISETEFAPHKPITREQMAVMFLNYITYREYELEALTESPALFDDNDAISLWAGDAVLNMQSLGIIKGKPGNTFDPQGLATRAEGCTVFKRLIEVILLQQQ